VEIFVSYSRCDGSLWQLKNKKSKLYTYEIV
jgi:hypothetical protein